jgi:5'-nucleotidase
MKKIIISFLIVFLVVSCKNNTLQLVKIKGKLFAITKKIAADSSVVKTYLPYKYKMEKEMNTVLTFTLTDLVATDGDLESSLGNLLADLCYQKGNFVFKKRTGKNIDFAMFNFRGIRAGIPKGNVTTQNAFNLMPFENNLVVVELSPKKLRELIQYLITQKKAHPLSKQVRLIITKNGYNFSINGKPINDNETYFVLTSDYLQHGGDHMDFFKNPVHLYALDYKMRSAIIDYFKETDTLKSNLDGRFIIKN